MTTWRRFVLRLFTFLRPSSAERELAREVDAHLALLEDEQRLRGLSAEDARFAAKRAFGGVDQAKERQRDARSFVWLEQLRQDVRYGVRALVRNPAFTLVALVTLAVGIGANTAIYSLVHGVLLESLPVASPARLYKLGDRFDCCAISGLQTDWVLFSYPFYREARDHTPAFESLAAAQAGRPGLSVRRAGAAAPSEPFRGEFVSGNYFSTLGVQAFAGRLLGPADDRAGAPPVAVASYRAWQKFGLDPSLIGHDVMINGRSVTLAGVTPPAFFGDRLEANPPDFWMPLALEPVFARENSLLHARSTAWLYLLGRLRAGARPSQVQAQLTTELRQYLLTPGNANANQDLDRVGSQVIRLAPGGGGINAMKHQVRRRTHPADAGGRMRPPARLRQPGEPAARARRRRPGADRDRAGDGRIPQAGSFAAISPRASCSPCREVSRGSSSQSSRAGPSCSPPSAGPRMSRLPPVRRRRSCCSPSPCRC